MENDKVICQGCKQEVDYINIPEKGMGYIECPNCGRFIDQTGREVGENEERKNKCNQCGQCCRAKVAILGKVFYTHKYCEYLKWNENGKAVCTVYDKRYEIAKWCGPVEGAIAAGLVPESCAYVQGMQYKTRICGEITENGEEK